MSSGRESHHPDAIGDDGELGGTRANGANRPLCVAKLDRMMVPRPEAVFQYERGNTHGVVPIGPLTPFMFHRQRAVAATRRDDDCCARASARRAIRGDGGLVGIRLTERARRTVFPQQNLLRRCGWRRRTWSLRE